jgi:IS4 transposase
LFPWARFRQTKAAVKVHTLLDLRGNIPAFVHISEAKLHEVNVLDEMTPEAGAFYVMDRGYLDFDRLYRFTVESAFFVVRNKSNVILRRQSSQKIDKSTGIRCDQTVLLDTANSAARYPDKLRRVRFRDPETGKTLEFLTNNFTLPPLTIARIYKCRWQVELFFKWIKQHLRIKAFYGTSENAVKTQIWIAISVYVLVAIVRKRLMLKVTLYTFLQVLSLSLFEKSPILRAFEDAAAQEDLVGPANQLILFDF